LQANNSVLDVFCAFQNEHALLGTRNSVFRVYAQDLSRLALSIFELSQLGMMIGRSAHGFTQPTLRFVILLEQVNGAMPTITGVKCG